MLTKTFNCDWCLAEIALLPAGCTIFCDKKKGEVQVLWGQHVPLHDETWYNLCQVCTGKMLKLKDEDSLTKKV